MITFNDVFSVLVTTGDAAILAKDNLIDNLGVGQIGFFNADTNVSFDATSTTVPNEFYIALGVDKNGDAAMDSIKTSAGAIIQTRNINAASVKTYVAPLPYIFNIVNYKADCDKEYMVKLEFKNSFITGLQGNVPYSKTYSVKTSCCEGCGTGCPSGDANELSMLLLQAINADTQNFANATIISRQDIIVDTETEGHLVIPGFGTDDVAKGDVLTLAQVQALLAYNVGKTEANKLFTDLQITSENTNIWNYCNINLKYNKPRQTMIIAFLTEGFSCNGSIVTVQNLRFEQGAGYDVKHQEYIAGGWGNPGTYRVSNLLGLAKENFEYYANVATNYTTFTLSYHQKLIDGGINYDNPLATEIYIPVASTTTRASLVAIFNKVIGNLGLTPLA